MGKHDMGRLSVQMSALHNCVGFQCSGTGVLRDDPSNITCASTTCSESDCCQTPSPDEHVKLRRLIAMNDNVMSNQNLTKESPVCKTTTDDFFDICRTLPPGAKPPLIFHDLIGDKAIVPCLHSSTFPVCAIGQHFNSNGGYFYVAFIIWGILIIFLAIAMSVLIQVQWMRIQANRKARIQRFRQGGDASETKS